ncbi:MdtA/MuxA family multidrug efflux RND transporter periplasmic adaptor subunit [Thiobacillus sedimenti]|uniref:MdtA/MuxA family multidrug efflux RND transporter periplasmic adaptor subunit n=1 Tax=Thiobacillus sedimenti TaxID=3110231 RepID=A0ABZ1CME0_9PROT|nr:MdtA/MuxA family multidrug efflux RND transporter periplasmic adaptor subunit [Thiobacillus sp. SCUT-2]WRS40562.1 MdtA/MuxA family multidrug efflux RND transporter periplasmic adaptor subunit [Thiobacillus sp. SCUT-2]
MALLLAGLIGGAWYWSSHRAPPVAAGGGHGGMKGSGGNHAQPVSVETIQKRDIRVWVDALGTVTPRNLALVRVKVDGTLLRVNFREGQMVKAGDLLAEIDPRPFRIQLEQARGQLTRDTALLDNARLDLARYRDLLAKDAIARQQVDSQEALVRQCQGTVVADRALVDNAALQLGYTRVVAPASGRIGLRQVDPGNQVHASDAAGLATIVQLQPTTVVFSVPEARLPAISRRAAAHQSLPVEAWDREQRARLAEGRLLTTDNQIDPATGTIRVKAEFANRDNRLFPNQFVNVRLLLDVLHQVVAIPTAAVQRGDKGSFVYRVGADGTVRVVPVQPGAVDGDWMAVSGALEPGDKLVVDGADKLRDGARAEVVVPGAGKAARGTGASQGKTRPAAGDLARGVTGAAR